MGEGHMEKNEPVSEAGVPQSWGLSLALGLHQSKREWGKPVTAQVEPLE